jgi:ATP-binding cassette subfamily C protein CydD
MRRSTALLQWNEGALQVKAHDQKLLACIRPVSGILAFTVVLGLMGAIATIAQMSLLSRIVNTVFLLHKGLAQVFLSLALLIGAILIRAGLLWWREVTSQRAAIRLKTSLRERVFTHLLQLGPAFSKGERTGEMVAVLNEGVERLDPFVSRYLLQLVLSILVPLLILVVIWPVDWFSAVLLLFAGPVIPLLMALVGSNTQKRTEAQWATLSCMSAHFLDVMQGLTTLKLFGHSRDQQERIAYMSDRYRDKTLQVLRYAFLSGAVLEFMTLTAIGVIATTLGVRLLNHPISFDRAFFILLLTPEFYRPLQELGSQRHAAMEGRAAAKRLFEILETPALDAINLRLSAHTRTALVGRSSAGKSTLVNLLMRFMDATSGTISANGVPITALPPDEWRKYVALVPQRPYLFYGTVRENICLARPQASDHEVEEAAALSGAISFIDELPHGFDTQVGEQGTHLSAGQAQRIAIARAILKNAPILILDEPTSSLDPENEMLIRQSLTTLMRDRTVLVIAHRFNTIAQADHFVVLECGRIIEAGTRDSFAQSDVYTNLFSGVSTQELSEDVISRQAAHMLQVSEYAFLVNGQDIRGYSLRDLRKLVGVVSQDTYIFNDTLGANVLLARSEAGETEIEAVLERGNMVEHGTHEELLAMEGLYRQLYDIQQGMVSISV